MERCVELKRIEGKFMLSFEWFFIQCGFCHCYRQAVGGIIEGGPEICQSKVIFSMRMALLEIQAWLLYVLLLVLNGKVCNKIKDRCLLTVPNPHARSNKELWGLVFIVRLEPPQVLRDASLIRLSYQKKHTTTYVGYKTWPIRTKPLQPCLKNSDENVVYNTYGFKP